MAMRDAKASTNVGGVDYFFSSESNRQTFAVHPDNYVQLAADDFRFYMNQALTRVMDIQETLASDSTVGIAESAAGMAQVMDYAGQRKPSLDAAGLKTYQSILASARDAAAKIAAMKKPAIEEVREAFWLLSEYLIAYAEAFNKDSAEGTPLYIIHCPMAHAGKGGSWMQRSDKTANPYFGASMLECGKLQEEQLFKCMIMTENDVDPTVSVAFQGKTYYFCCRKCVKKFIANPDQYLK